MSKTKILLTDIVNLNADASCLSSEQWLNMLRKGSNSYLYQWLSVYVKAKKKVSLGITGATLADMRMHNPETIDFINKNRNIFEIILRPFSHDIALLRSKEGFLLNLETGIKTLKREFNSYQNYFLPPEFMLTNEQVYILHTKRIEGTFINPSRFKSEIENRLPENPYYVKGLIGTEIKCIPLMGTLTQAYLQGIHYYNADVWNKLLHTNNKIHFSWRDGESSFFVPDGNEREYAWLQSEKKNIERLFLSEALHKVEFDNNKNLKENHYHYYPVHSFTAWMKEFRMIGFVNKVIKTEGNIAKCNKKQKALWLQIINSDILSSIEKNSPQIKLKLKKEDTTLSDYTIWRCERGLEGEEFLALLSSNFKRADINAYLNKSMSHHMLKLRARLQYLNKIL